MAVVGSVPSVVVQPGSRRRFSADVRTIAAVAVVGVLVLFTRRPDAFTHPQLWAEDGRYWYAEAYNLGVQQTLLRVHTGYLQTFSRLVADGSLVLPLHLVPRWFSLWALLAQLAPALVVVSGRFARVVPSRRARVVLAVVYFAVPASAEVDMNVTNAQWHLAMLGFALLVATRPVSRAGHVFDVASLLLMGLSGPFAIFLAPVAAIVWWLRRDGASALRVAVVGVCAVTQGILSLLYAAQRSPERLGAGPRLLLQILGNHLGLSPLLGNGRLLRLEHSSPARLASIALVAGVVVVVLAAYAVWRGPVELRLLWLFTALILAAELAVPQASTTRPQWGALALAGTERYFVIPALATLYTLVWLVLTRQPALVRGVAGLVLLVVLAIGVTDDWRYPAYVNYPLAKYEQALDHALPGQSILVPTNPPGWSMRLDKR